MTREQKIEALRRIAAGELTSLTELYAPDGPFIKCDGHYFNDGYRWTESEFEQMQQRLQAPQWLPEVWYHETAVPGLYEWLMEHTQPINAWRPGKAHPCSEVYRLKMDELFGGCSDELYIF